jgi:hypothetical protein
MISYDGITWTARTISAKSWSKVIWVEEPEYFVACAPDTLATSPDGLTWTLLNIAGYNMGGITWVPSLLRIFIVGNDNGYIYGGTVIPVKHVLTFKEGTLSLKQYTTNTPDIATYLQLDLSSDNARKLTTTTWTTGSDRRLKTDIEVADYATCYDNMKAIDLVRFAWDSNIPAYAHVSDRHKLGWIAQDVQPVFPNAVSVRALEHGMSNVLNLNTDQIYAMMYGAIRKLQDDVEKLKCSP